MSATEAASSIVPIRVYAVGVSYPAGVMTSGVHPLRASCRPSPPPSTGRRSGGCRARSPRSVPRSPICDPATRALGWCGLRRPRRRFRRVPMLPAPGGRPESRLRRAQGPIAERVFVVPLAISSSSPAKNLQTPSRTGAGTRTVADAELSPQQEPVRSRNVQQHQARAAS